MNVQNSSITTLPDHRASSTGAGLGEVGAEIGRATAPPRSALSPSETRKSLLDFLAQRCGLRVTILPSGGGTAETVKVQAMTGSPKWHLAVAAAERSLISPNTPDLTKWLAMLDASTARRSEDGASSAIRVAAYLEVLADEPADILRHVLTRHPFHFWPTRKELLDLIRAQAAARRALLWRLKNRMAEPLCDDRPQPTAEARAAVQATVDRFVGRCRA